MASERPSSQRLVRFAISILIIGHLLAVVLPPLSLQTRGPVGQSPSVSTLLRMVEGYSQLLYIDRGYAFFAPDPGPSHLLQAAITDSEGNREEQMFPDREVQWPRLLYHRHFMLSEFLEEIYQPPGPPAGLAEVSPDEAEYWIETRSRYEHVRQSLVDHLRYVHPDRDVAIRRVEHLIPDLLDYQQEPIDLRDERLYRVMLDQAAATTDRESDSGEGLPDSNVGNRERRDPETDQSNLAPSAGLESQSSNQSSASDQVYAGNAGTYFRAVPMSLGRVSTKEIPMALRANAFRWQGAIG